MDVYESVFECNQRFGHQAKPMGRKCPRCSEDKWRTFWGVNSEYRSEYNPGEFIQLTCANCGYVGPEEPS